MGGVVEDGEGDGGEGLGAGEGDAEKVEGCGSLVICPVVIWGGGIVLEEAVDRLEGVIVGYVRGYVGKAVGSVGVGEDVRVAF